MQTIAVTGSTGFVGRAVVASLLRCGYRVRALARKGSAGKLAPHPNLEVIEGDPRNVDDVTRLVSGANALLHLIGTRRAEMKRTGVTYADIDLGTVRVAIEAMKRVGVDRILLLSAADIGDSEYVRTKRQAEAAVRESGLRWTIFRPSFILGKGQQWPIIMSPILNLLALFPGRIGDIAKRARNITREQLANAMIWSLEQEEAVGSVMDVTGIRNH
jgi:uncharacterized protein YbjT (DUF2867 family)